MKHLFIVNPVAGGSDRTETIAAEVQALFAARSDNYEIYTTKGPMDAAEKIRREADLRSELRVYACGGDGTLNECVCGAAGRENVAVTPYPSGTGNDFVKVFGGDADRFRFLPDLVEGELRAMDVMDCNGRKSLNICSVGIDARIGCNVHKYTDVPVIGGKSAYITSTAVQLFKGIRRPIRVNCGGAVYVGDMTLVCACNGSHYGGSFMPVPEARPDDGVLEFLVVKGVSRLEFVRIVGAYAKGKYADYPHYITHLRGDSIELESPTEMIVNVDGEAIHAKKLSIRLEKAALNFVVPKGMKYFET
ncbi:MAG: BmrU protein [Oscillospiraceae bacterium]|nr:BmrU protein [Oscillospiraceae bacterium]